MDYSERYKKDLGKDPDGYRRKRNEYLKEWSRKQREKDPEAWKQKQKRYNATQLKKNRESPERTRIGNEKRRIIAKKERLRIRNEILTLLGGTCVKCGFSDKRALQIDHVNGGGKKHYESKSSAFNYYKGILASIKSQEGKYQLLCANCNWIKRFENGEVPAP